jgi:hypothetical protein
MVVDKIGGTNSGGVRFSMPRAAHSQAGRHRFDPGRPLQHYNG